MILHCLFQFASIELLIVAIVVILTVLFARLLDRRWLFRGNRCRLLSLGDLFFNCRCSILLSICLLLAAALSHLLLWRWASRWLFYNDLRWQLDFLLLLLHIFLFFFIFKRILVIIPFLFVVVILPFLGLYWLWILLTVIFILIIIIIIDRCGNFLFFMLFLLLHHGLLICTATRRLFIVCNSRLCDRIWAKTYQALLIDRIVWPGSRRLLLFQTGGVVLWWIVCGLLLVSIGFSSNVLLRATRVDFDRITLLIHLNLRKSDILLSNLASRGRILLFLHLLSHCFISLVRQFFIWVVSD